MFGTKKELKALAAVKGISANELTEEQLAAVNAEFESEGFELEAFAKGETRISQADVDAAVAQAKTETETAMSEKVATLQATIASNDAQMKADAARIAELEAEPLEDNAPAKSGDSAHSSTEESSTPIADAFTAEVRARAAKLSK